MFDLGVGLGVGLDVDLGVGSHTLPGSLLIRLMTKLGVERVPELVLAQ